MLPASFLAPALIVLVAINVVPLFYTVTTSFEDYYLPKVASRHFNGLGNYAELLADDRFWGALGRTLLFVTVALAIEVALGFGVALMLIRQKRLVGLLRGFILLPIIITPIAVTFVWRLMLPALILVEIWQHTPELMLIIFTGLLTLPKEVIEAAVVDGARASQIFFAIKLPLLRPILMVGVLFRTIDLFKTFDLFYILTRGGPGVSTETLAVYTYTVGFSFLRLGYGSALALVLFLIILAASFLIVRWGDVRLG
ncbi:MAG: sugar ABC transporter permease [Rhizobiales bacterium]|nr:sugar ABC transporter permease [Hyphomicrobiales bacterium]